MYSDKCKVSSEQSQIKSYADLKVWQYSHNLALDILKLSKTTKKTNLNYEIWKQIIRSCFSVPANIVEGFHSHRGKTYVSHLEVSRGSAGETQYWLLVLKDTGDITLKNQQLLDAKYSEVIKMLSKIINVINSKTNH